MHGQKKYIKREACKKLGEDIYKKSWAKITF